ncbi:MAG: hypothetical protein ACKVQT_31895 [Burkholderiales bacterium]
MTLTDSKARLLGTLIVNDLFQKAVARPQGSRPFTLYIDECTDYLNSDIARSIDRTRKFGLQLVLSHQRLGQLAQDGKEDILNAVMSVQSKVVFGGLEVPDAERIAREIFSGEFNLNAAKKKFATPVVVDHVVEWLASESEARGTSQTTGEGETIGTGTSESSSTSLTRSLDEPKRRGTEATASGRTSFLTHQTSTSRAESTSQSHTSGRHQSLRPVLRMGPGPPKSLDELVYEATAKLKDLPQQTAILKPIGRHSLRLRTPTLVPSVANARRVDAFVAGVLERSGFSAMYDAVTKDIDDRLRALGAPVDLPAQEPATFRQPVRAPRKTPARRTRQPK